jgi:hypothetical protein
MYLHIIWHDLQQDGNSTDIYELQKLHLQTITLDEIENAIIEITLNIRGKNYPHKYEIVQTNESIEKLKKVIEKDGVSIVYTGDGSDYKNLLVSIFFVIIHMTSTYEVLRFMKKLATELLHVNEIAANKLKNGVIANIDEVSTR